MRKLKARTLSLPLFLFAICATFQNCDAGFKYDSSTGQLSSLSTGDLTGVFGIQLYAPGGASPLSDSTSMDTGFVYELHATGTYTQNALLSWSINSAASTATCMLASVGNVLKYSIKCSSSGVVSVVLSAVWPDSSMTQATLTHNVGSVASTPAPSTDPNIVNFTIPNGTQGSPWNTSSMPIYLFVGQTLKLTNADTRNHRIHANGNPFVHQVDDTAPGQTSSLAVTATSTVTTGLYDHDTGTSAVVYIVSTDGDQVYKNACASCHGASSATSSKRGASYTSITNAIANQSQMKNISLSMQELKALAYVLNK